MMKTNVLIIGAGPTGLMAACQLQRFGIDCIIVDKKDGPTKESRALVVHARSLEIYAQMGIATEALKQAEMLNKIQFISKGKKIQEFSMGIIGAGLSEFPYIIILEQSKNEQLLYDQLTQLGRDVQWQTEMLDLKQEDHQCLITLRNPESSFTVEADYIIAADGAKSTVRHYLNVPFEGSTYEHIFFVADTKLQWDWGHKALSLCLSNESFLGLFPMRGEDRFRAIGTVPTTDHPTLPENFEEISAFVQEQAGISLQFSETNWFSIYKVHHRCVKNFRKGRVFFAGDAAHVHSPVGGQGMNTGLQDAYNLAWKLAYVVKGYGGEKLLNSYNRERLPFAKKLVASTDRAFSVITSKKWYNRWLRLYIFPFLVPLIFRLRAVRIKWFKLISQIGIRYIDSDLTLNRIDRPLFIKAGERFPFLKNKAGQSIYELMNEPGFYALVFCVDEQKKLMEEMELLAMKFAFIQIINLSGEKMLAIKLKIRKDTIIVVRPDHYIGLVTDEGSKVAGDYFREVMND